MHGCHCAKSWDYMQETYEECSNTKNFDRRWCKIVDGLSCDGSQKLPDGNYFDTCWEVQTGDETVNGCKCKSKWEYNGENITRRCIKTGGHPKPWCAVKPGCAKAQAAGNGKDEWDTCKDKDKETEKEKETEKPEETPEKKPNATEETKIEEETEEQGEETVHKCHCKLKWRHGDKAFTNCAVTPDYNTSWCKIMDGPTCPGAQKRPDGVYFDECVTVEEEKSKGVQTVHNCHCKQSWKYKDKVRSDCLKSPDHPHPWCQVEPDCPGAQKGVQDWDDCKEQEKEKKEAQHPEWGEETDHGCHCKLNWEYHGVQHSNCEETADSKQPWCFVADPKSCEGGHESTTNAGEVWDTCPLGVETVHHCHCKLLWKYGGLEHSNCVHTKDQKDPWCYVADGESCAGAIKTSRKGKYWDTCHEATPPTTTPSPLGEETLHDCHCLTTWVYGGQEFHNCEKTIGMDEEWCYVSDGPSCPGSKKGKTGQYWDVCEDEQRGVETLHSCHCKLSWTYQGEVRSNCFKSADHDVPWCYVEPACPGAKKGKEDWDDCKAETEAAASEPALGQETNGKCHCKLQWSYHGLQHSGCTSTADSKKPWCYVADPDVCENGHVSESGEIYDFCPLGVETAHHCHCKLLWQYGGHDHTNCIHTADHKEPWCYVSDGEQCAGAIKTSRTGNYWDTCLEEPQTTTPVPLGEQTLHKCHCRPTWAYGSNTFHNCAVTPDNNVPWCYISEGPNCIGSKKGSSGMYWDVCQRGETGVETVHECNCKLDWVYHGKKVSNCITSPDHPRPWCYVEPGCDEAFKGAEPWDDCLPEPLRQDLGEETLDGCHCLKSWDYHGLKLRNCAWTADNNRPWCFTSEGLDCIGGHVSASMPEMVWDYCPIGEETTHGCHCKMQWEYGGLTHANCIHTKDHHEPWCYVAETECKGAIRTHRSGDYWDTCKEKPEATNSPLHDELLTGEVTFHNCHCEPEWTYKGKRMENCEWTDDKKEPWCYVADGADCHEALVTKEDNKFWDKCRVGPETANGCHCKGRWEHQGKTMFGCAKTGDKPFPWCYIGDTDRCKEAKDGELGKWDQCIMEGELTTHECHCEKTWEYQGKTYENCQKTKDSKTRWCYVADGAYCQKATINAQGRKWDTCPVLGEETKTGCHCLQKWTYAGLELSNCWKSPDHSEPWCFVSEGNGCKEGQLSTETGLTWDECSLGVETTHGCHCNKQWKYGGLWHKGCIVTKDSPHPWCYVSDFMSCKGALRTHKGGKYWDTCYDDAEVE